MPECTFTPPSGKRFYRWELYYADGKEGYRDPGSSLNIYEDAKFVAIWLNADSARIHLCNLEQHIFSEQTVPKNSKLVLPDTADGTKTAFWIDSDGMFYAVNQTITVQKDNSYFAYPAALGMILENGVPVLYQNGNKVSRKKVKLGNYYFTFGNSGEMVRQ